MAESIWESVVYPAAVARAKARFRGDPDREDKVQDAVSVAWELHQKAPHAPPQSIAVYAVKRVAIDRQFRQSIRSIDGPPSRSRPKAQRAEFEVGAIFREKDNPARIVSFRLDFLAWLSTLTERQREMLTALATGDRTDQVAQQLGCTPANVSQHRRSLAESWYAFRS